jgi:hypothetical protein
MRVPLWVRIWALAVLAPVNLASFAARHTPTGRWTARSAVLVLVTGIPAVLLQRGFSKIVGAPHLLFWTPLLIFTIRRLGQRDTSRAEARYGVVLLIVNAISLIFDTVDTWRYIKGEREVA